MTETTETATPTTIESNRKKITNIFARSTIYGVGGFSAYMAASVLPALAHGGPRAALALGIVGGAGYVMTICKRMLDEGIEIGKPKTEETSESKTEEAQASAPSDAVMPENAGSAPVAAPAAEVQAPAAPAPVVQASITTEEAARIIPDKEALQGALADINRQLSEREKRAREIVEKVFSGEFRPEDLRR